MEISLQRLKLIPASLEMIKAEIESPVQLAELLNAQKPYNWPPPLNNENSQKYYLDFITQNPDSMGWGMWYFLLKNNSNKKDILVGNGGFKGGPNKNGEVEIGYSVIELYHRRGFATEAASGLISWAFEDPQVKKIVAHTLVGLRPSIRVLEKNNFAFAGNTKEKGVIRFELKKKNFIK
jgi:RimJ/RimL family protein N-acetyltransferase